jgi:hypothetical protein
MKFFTPAWKSENEERALHAVEKMTGQKKLAKVAKKSGHWRVRKAAVEKLTGPEALKNVAEKYFSDIIAYNEWDNDTCQKMKAVINIVKRFPGFLREKWKTKTFHGDIPHADFHTYDNHYDHCDPLDPCLGIHYHVDGPDHRDFHTDSAAVSRHIPFPRYPLND